METVKILISALRAEKKREIKELDLKIQKIKNLTILQNTNTKQISA